ncbi:unnamed protein product [Prorocentrum cordatum]|uniref:Uncharacterized protein n=1 Tax=Prorocentrum cordatum TaxID=2364126 RepID=A0ABN9UUK1_9DINO|nr:unnamed protein product [Polarella glacialis]
MPRPLPCPKPFVLPRPARCPCSAEVSFGPAGGESTPGELASGSVGKLSLDPGAAAMFVRGDPRLAYRVGAAGGGAASVTVVHCKVLYDLEPATGTGRRRRSGELAVSSLTRGPARDRRGLDGSPDVHGFRCSFGRRFLRCSFEFCGRPFGLHGSTWNCRGLVSFLRDCHDAGPLFIRAPLFESSLEVPGGSAV